MKCKNCGAELNNGKCEYCGSVFPEDMRYTLIPPKIEIDKDVYKKMVEVTCLGDDKPQFIQAW